MRWPKALRRSGRPERSIRIGPFVGSADLESISQLEAQARVSNAPFSEFLDPFPQGSRPADVGFAGQVRLQGRFALQPIGDRIQNARRPRHIGRIPLETNRLSPGAVVGIDWIATDQGRTTRLDAEVERGDRFVRRCGDFAVATLEHRRVEETERRVQKGVSGERGAVDAHHPHRNPDSGPVGLRSDRILKPDDAVEIRFSGYRERPTVLPARLIPGIRICGEPTLESAVQIERWRIRSLKWV